MNLAVLYLFAIYVMIKLVVIALVSVKSCYHSCKGEIFVYAHISRGELFNFIKGIGKSVLGIENRRLVHIVPEALNSHICENSILIAEPFSCFGIKEVGEVDSARPYCAHKITALGVFAEVVVFYALLVNVVALLNLNSGVDYRNKPYALCFHVV